MFTFNTAWSQVEKDRSTDPELCPLCGALLKFEWENKGFSEPNPTHWEIISAECPTCGYTDK